MQVKLTSNGEILFLDGDHLNRNSLNRKTLIVTPQTALATRESIWVQFGDDKDYENANANILEPIRLSEVEGNYKIIIPDEVIKKPGTWYMTLAVRMYSTNGAVYTEQLTSDKVSFTVNDSFPVSDREYASNGTIEDMWQQILFADLTAKESAESAAESAAQAQTAQAGAEAARAAAVVSAENAQAAKNEAFISAADAQKHLEDVYEAKDQVSDYRDEVEQAIIYIRNMGLEIAQDVTNVENSASAAASSASAAAQSAGQSAQSALQAQEYAQQAQEYAQKHYEIVASYDALPQPGNSAYIYLVPSSTASGANNYEEYLWITNTSSYEFIGMTSDVDLSNYAQVNGTYSGMTVGAVAATQLTNQDIHDFQGSEYWGKTYFGAGGNAVQNKPEGVDGFYLEVLRGGTSSTIHRLIATADTSGESVSPNIYIEQYITSWSSWEEVATSDGTYSGMTVGNATNASSLGSIPAANYAQIDGSYAGLTSGQAEMLTDPFTIGRDTPTATSGYVKFATVSLPMEYRAGVARFEILDKNYVNTQTLPCGIELAMRNLGAQSCTIHANLLYGSSYYLSKIYACVKTGSYPITADLYYDMTSDNPQNTMACVKPLFTYFRASNTSFTFITDNEIVSSLPTDTTNTLLSDIYTPVTEAFSAINDSDGNQISTAYAKQTGNYPNLGAGHLQHQGISSTSTSTIGWYKVGTSTASNVPDSNSSVSVIFLVNGVYGIQAAIGSQRSQSGLLELDVSKYNSVFNAHSLSVLSGNLDVSQFCAVRDNTTVTLYWKNDTQYGKTDFVILTQQCEKLTDLSNLFMFDTSFYGTTAPEGAVYAVVRNRASEDSEGNDIATTYAPLASPVFTGTPTAPTPATSDNSKKIATTAFVQAVVGSALYEHSFIFSHNFTNIELKYIISFSVVSTRQEPAENFQDIIDMCGPGVEAFKSVKIPASGGVYTNSSTYPIISANINFGSIYYITSDIIPVEMSFYQASPGQVNVPLDADSYSIRDLRDDSIIYLK